MNEENLIKYEKISFGKIKEKFIALITLQKPVFTIPLGEKLIHLITRAEKDEEIRVIVLTGTGNTFCAGANLKNTSDAFGSDKMEEPGGEVALKFLNCTKPIIAAINGHCIGMGACLILSCTMRIILEKAKVGFVFSKRGLAPVAGSSFLLPQLVGKSKALEWTCTGRIFQAQDEKDSGLFNYIEKDLSSLMNRTFQICEEIKTQTSPLSVSLCKFVFDFPLNNFEESLKKEQKYFQEMLKRNDFSEGVLSFLEKRNPNFTSSTKEFKIIKSKL